MLLHPLCELVTDAGQVGIGLELRLARSTVLVCAFVSHEFVYVSHGCVELLVFPGLFDFVSAFSPLSG